MIDKPEVLPEASSECPLCGKDSPHVHTKKEIAIMFREKEIRELFEKTIQGWWPYMKEWCRESWGQAPILTHRKSDYFHNIKKDSPEDVYQWIPVQLMWEAFKYIPLYVQPPLPSDDVPRMDEALEIKDSPFAAHAPESVTIEKLREIWNKCRSDKEVIAAIYALIYPDDAHAPKPESNEWRCPFCNETAKYFTQETTMPKKVNSPVLVTTAHRGVFFGYLTGKAGKSVTLESARNCVYWSADVRGFIGLAVTGPSSGCRVGPAADIELNDVTSIVSVTPEAVAKWETQPWK